jgi:hypothetical protein
MGFKIIHGNLRNMDNGKNSKWFKHDSDALDDPKMMFLVTQFGMEGYGLFWMLIEHLTKQPDYHLPVALIEPLSRRYQVSKEKLDVIVRNFGLFEIMGDFFHSPSLTRRMEQFERRVITNRQNAQKGWEKKSSLKAIPEQSQSNGNAMAEQSQSNGNEDKIREDKIREDKIREDKIREEKITQDKKKKKTIPPSFEDLCVYCSDRKSNVNPKQFFDFYESKGWMIGKDKMKDWQAAVRTWEQRSPQVNSAIIPGEDPVERNLRLTRAARKAREAKEAAEKNDVINDPELENISENGIEK